MSKLHILARLAQSFLAVSVTIASGLLFQFGHLA
jgi:hypothetical protein